MENHETVARQSPSVAIAKDERMALSIEAGETWIKLPLNLPLSEVERIYTQALLSLCENKTQLAEMLKISRRSIYNKLAAWSDRGVDFRTYLVEKEKESP